MQVLQQTTEYDALQWAAAVKQYYQEERRLIAAAAEQATRASAERAGIGQWLSGLVLREGKVGCPPGKTCCSYESMHTSCEQ